MKTLKQIIFIKFILIFSVAAFGQIRHTGGKLGVGTTSPTDKIHIVGDARVTGAIKDSNNEPGTLGQLLSTTGTGTDWIDVSGYDALDSVDVHRDSIISFAARILTNEDSVASYATRILTNEDSVASYATRILTNEDSVSSYAVRLDSLENGGGADNLGDHTATQNIQLGNYYLSGDGDNEGVFVSSTGLVGIGTNSPSQLLQISGSTPQLKLVGSLGYGTNIRFSNTNSDYQFGASGAEEDGFLIYDFNGPGSIFQYDKTGGHRFLVSSVEKMRIEPSGEVGIGQSSPSYPLHMGSGAHVTTGGVWTDASSRDYKENIKNLSTKKAFNTLKKLQPVTYNYKKEKENNYVGFIAEDVPELIAQKDRKSLSPMNVVGVLTKVVQEQQKEIEKFKNELKEVWEIINKCHKKEIKKKK